MLGNLAVAALSVVLTASPVTGMTDEQLAGTRVVTGFSGHHPPKALRRMVRAGQVSGVILFDGNVGGRKSVRRLTSELQAIPRPPGTPPLLVTVDQEGGLVRRLPGPPKPSAESIGSRGAAFAERLGRATGQSLRSMGVNVDLAPVLDLGRPGRAIESEGRTFARTPVGVSETAVGFARGLATGGVAATAKHFPGLGAARVNTDNAVQKIRLPAAKTPRGRRTAVHVLHAGRWGDGDAEHGDLSGLLGAAGGALARDRDGRASRPARLPGRLHHRCARLRLGAGGGRSGEDCPRHGQGRHGPGAVHRPGDAARAQRALARGLQGDHWTGGSSRARSAGCWRCARGSSPRPLRAAPRPRGPGRGG